MYLVMQLNIFTTMVHYKYARTTCETFFAVLQTSSATFAPVQTSEP